MNFECFNWLVSSLTLSSILVSPNLILAQLSPSTLQQQAQQEHYAEAESLWKQVLRQRPNSAEAYYNLGLNLHHQFKVPEAIQAYRDTTRLNPKYEVAYINLGLAWIQSNNYAEAVTAFRRVIALPNRESEPASTHTLAHYNLAIIWKRQGKPEEALQEVQQALKRTPTFTPVQQLLKQFKQEG